MLDATLVFFLLPAVIMAYIILRGIYIGIDSIVQKARDYRCWKKFQKKQRSKVPGKLVEQYRLVRLVDISREGYICQIDQNDDSKDATRNVILPLDQTSIHPIDSNESPRINKYRIRSIINGGEVMDYVVYEVFILRDEYESFIN